MRSMLAFAVGLLLGVAAHAAVPLQASKVSVSEAGQLERDAQIELARQIVMHGSPQGAHSCATCHGEEGQGKTKAAFPHLAGLPAPYLIRQLRHFNQMARDNPSMQAIAHNLSESQIVALAAYFSRLVPPPVMGATVHPPALGEQLALHGSGAVPACVTCHGPGGRGLGGALSAAFPPIAGQPAVYLERQLVAWRNDKRPVGPDGLMGAVGKHLTVEQIRAVSLYFAAQPTLSNVPTAVVRP